MSPYLAESVRGHDVFIVQSTFAPADNFMELLLMIDAARRASAGECERGDPYFWLCPSGPQRQATGGHCRQDDLPI